MGIASWLRRRARGERVELSEEGILHHLADGRTEWLSWCELERVEVLTTSRETRAEDFFFLLSGSRGQGCVVPHGLSEGLFERLHQLPQFDLNSFIRATTSTEHARFLCWTRQPES
jgi:hypothetical protein